MAEGLLSEGAARVELETLWRKSVSHAYRRYREKAVISDALAAECRRPPIAEPDREVQAGPKDLCESCCPWETVNRNTILGEARGYRKIGLTRSRVWRFYATKGPVRSACRYSSAASYANPRGTRRDQPPLPKLAWLAAALGLLNAAYLIFVAIFRQTFIAIPVALIPLMAAVGILTA